MKRIVSLMLFVVAAALSAAAQDSIATPRLSRDILEESRRDSAAAHIVALPLAGSPASYIDMMPAHAFFSPWSYYGPASWSLHEGFNAQVGFSVSAGLGKHRPKGAGFGEHIAAAYAVPFGKDKRWIGAIGLYANRLDWGTYHRTEAGIAAALGYSVNDWCNLYAYGSYNFVPGNDSGPNPYALRYYGGPYGYGYGPHGYGCGPFGYGGGPYGYWSNSPYDPYNNLRGRIGAAAEFKVGSSATITVAFEHDFYDNNRALPVAPPPAAEPNNKPFSINDSPNSAGRGSNSRR